MANLGYNSYGKADVRVTKVIRHHDRHELIELSVDVLLHGDFADTYLTGDNRKVIATDSMKNTVYVVAKDHPLDSIEGFASSLAQHFTKTYSQVNGAMVAVRQSEWGRIEVAGAPHPHAFVGGTKELRTCSAHSTKGMPVMSSGIADLLLLKTTNSAFADFVRDEYTTLKDTTDRIFATSIRATWHYAHPPVSFNECFTTVRNTLLETFAGHKSLSVQQTLYAMGEAVLARCPELSDIHITMPNKHRILVDLKPFKRENNNDIFVWTDEPYGTITGHIERS